MLVPRGTKMRLPSEPSRKVQLRFLSLQSVPSRSMLAMRVYRVPHCRAVVTMNINPETDLDLEKLFLPAWAQESSSVNRYAKFAGGEDRPDRRDERRGGARPPRRAGGDRASGGAKRDERPSGPRREGGPGRPQRE